MSNVRKNPHGGDIYSREVQYDFSANLNPLGLPASVRKALVEHMDAFAHYPDIHCTELKQAIAEREHLFPTEHIVCGNGAADLIYRTVQAFSPRRALVIAPTFSEYERALKSFHCEVEHYLTYERDGFCLREDILNKIPGKDILFVCSPNNPVGNVVPSDLMERITEQCAVCGTRLVRYECFMDFTGQDSSRRTSLPGHVMILKAFTKIYAMAGLRLGYLLCGSAETARKIETCGQCWSVSVPAQIAGEAALRETGYIARTIRLVAAERAYLTRSLQEAGCRVYPSEANFLLFRCDCHDLEERLLQEGIAIRDCSDYIGLGRGYFRVAVRTHEENAALTEAVRRCMG